MESLPLKVVCPHIPPRTEEIKGCFIEEPCPQIKAESNKEGRPRLFCLSWCLVLFFFQALNVTLIEMILPTKLTSYEGIMMAK